MTTKHKILIIIYLIIIYSDLFAQSPVYPSTNPQVIETADSISILFPQQTGIVFQRIPGKFNSGIKRLWVGNRQILTLPNGYELHPELVFISNDSVGYINDWLNYLSQRLANGKKWPEVGGRTLTVHEIDTAEYLGYSIISDTVVIRTRVQYNGETGEVHWIFYPDEITIGTTTYSGMAWKVQLSGFNSAVWFNYIEPVQTRTGDWVLNQLWGKWLENRVGYSGNYSYEEKWYFADMQPFYFSGGSSGSCLSLFNDIIATKASAVQEAGKHFLTFRIPLGMGSNRETPAKLWLWSNKSLPTKWDAVDEWTNVYNWIGKTLRQNLHLGYTKPKPTIYWGQPGGDYFAEYLNGMIDTVWLDKFRIHDLPIIAKNGFRVIFFHTPWESDADHPKSDYKPGSGCWGSANAPWNFNTSPSIGGAQAMKNLITRAHELGVKIVLWSSPGHLSNSSPEFQNHPEWIKWRDYGVPEDFDWGDVTGTNQFGGYFDYAIQSYISTHDNLKYDGIWQDSFLTFGVLPDYKMTQPTPTLSKSLEMQQAFWQLGMTEVYIEGCGPLGFSTGGFGKHEPPTPPDLDSIRGKEYGLYHYVADAYPKGDSYYKALASGGVIGVASLEEFNKLVDTALIRRANFDYLEVMDKMEKRRLIASGDTLLGVEWTNSSNGDVVLFAFNSFTYPSSGNSMAKDVTTGDIFPVNGTLTTIPYHTFLLGNSISGISDGTNPKFELNQNYPNPFNQSTVIKYTIPKRELIQLKVYDMLGRQVKILVDEIQDPGNYTINVDASSLASGVYFYRIHGKTFEKVKKMILLK